MNDLNNPFDAFDRIYCISLPESNDRWERTMLEFERAGIHDRVQRIYANAPPSKLVPPNVRKHGQYGCTMSHLMMLGTALKEARGHILVVEDDFRFSDNIIEDTRNALDNIPSDWDMLYFGGQPVAAVKGVSGNVFRMGDVRGSYGYAIHKDRIYELFQFVLNSMMKCDTDVDGIYDYILGNFSKTHNCYGVYPLLVLPIPAFSIIGNGHRDYEALVQSRWREFMTWAPTNNSKTTVNFFWRGDNFSYLHRLTILSHIAVGHECVMWLSGDTPNSKHWIGDLHVTIKDADAIVDVTKFIEEGGNMKTASDLWSFTFLYKHGGIYADTDAVAIKPWPNDPWIAVSCNKGHPKEELSIGVMAAPAGCELFTACINDIKHSWGNVTLFADKYKEFFGHTKSTHNDRHFYPFPWTEWSKLLLSTDIPDVYSIHLYHTMLERNGHVHDNKTDYPKNSLLGKLIQRFDGE